MSQLDKPRPRLTRREILRLTAVAGLSTIGTALLTSCGPAATPAAPTTAPAAPTTAPAAPTTAPAAPTAASQSTTAPATGARVLPETIAGAGPLTGKTIKLGVGAPLAGDQATFGLEILYGTQYVADQVTEKGGLLGAKVVVVPGDDQHNPKIGETVAQKFVDDPDVMGVVGHYNSAVMMPTSAIYNKAHLVCIGTSTSNPQVTERGLNNVFRVCSRDDYAGRAAAIFVAEKLKVKKAASVDDQTTFGKGVADEFEKKLKKSYSSISLTHAAIKEGDKDFRPVLGSLPKDIEVLYYGGYAPEGALIAKQMKEVGLDKVKLVGSDGLYSEVDYIKAAGGAAEGSVCFAFAPPPDTVPESQSYIKLMEQKLGGTTAYANNTYDAAMIILSAIKRAGKLDREAIRAEVAKTDSFYGFSTKEPIAFDSKGDNKNAALFAYEVKGDHFSMIDYIPNTKLMD